MKSYDVINPIKLPGSHDIVVTGVVDLDDATAALLLATGSIRAAAALEVPAGGTVAPIADPIPPVDETLPPANETDTAGNETPATDTTADEQAPTATNVTPIKPTGRRK